MHIDFRRKSTLLLAGCLVLGSMHFPGINVQASTVANGTSAVEAVTETGSEVYTLAKDGTEYTYLLSNLKKEQSYNVDISSGEQGETTLHYTQQYGEVRYAIPAEVKEAGILSFTCNVKSADGVSISLKYLNACDNSEAVAVNYGQTTLSAEGLDSDKLNFIGIMSLAEGEYDITIDSITFEVQKTGSPEAGTGEITYNAADLKTYGRWNNEKIPLTEGKNILAFKEQYEEFCCDLPEALDMSKCQSITFKTANQGGSLCLKIYDAAKTNNTPLWVNYSISGNTEYTLPIDCEGDAYSIGIMSLDPNNMDSTGDGKNNCYSNPFTTELVSVTFVMDTATDDDPDVPMGDNLIQNPNFADADALSVWTAASGSAVVTSETAENAIVDDIKTYGKISGRTSNYECIAQDITNAVINNKDYQYSFYIMLDANDYKDAPEEMRTVEVSPIKTVGGETFYSQDVSGDTKKVLEPGVWTKFTGILSPSWSKDATLEKLVLRIIEQGTNYGQGEGIKGAYYVTGVELREIIQPNKEVQTDIPDLHAEVTKEMGEDFIMGTSICNSDLTDELTMQLVTKHFNAITLGNELKPDAMFGYAGTCPATETVTINGTELVVPKMDFSRAEKTLDYIYDWNQNHPENTIRVRGHVLVWHSQTPEWFFHEDYDKEKAYVDKDTMNLRLEWYIKSVAEHFTGPNSKYKDMFYGWDVVNEAVSDGTGTYRNDSENSSWWAVYKSNEFILNAFVFANKYMPESIELYYNDYNEWFTSKTNGIVQLLKDVKATEGARIDGMGMQGHYQTSGTPTIDEFEKAVRAYYEVVGKVQITELDFKATSDYDGTKKTQEAEFKKLAERYKAIYNSVRRLNEDGILIDNITVWGVIDKNSWLQTAGNVGGASDGRQKQCPLLFDDYYQAKDAYWVFVNPEPLTPSIKKLTIVQTKKDSFAPGVEQTFTRKNTAVSFTPVWNETGISVQVNVADTVNDATDKVTLYLSDAEGKIYSADCIRADAKETAEGYTAIVNIALDSSLLKTASSIGFDLVVTNGNEQLAYNDTTLTQATSSSYFAIATLKPYIAIQKGTAAVDGKAETDWDKAEAVPLTINLGSNVTANAKLLWDEKNLYILAEVKDSVLNSDSTNAHEKDSLEIFIDENNHKSSAYEEDDKQYRINYLNEQTFNGKKCLAENIESAVSLTEDGYIIEAAIKWTDITPEADTEIGLELQINDADETGKRIGTLSWYDQTGKGWSAPEVFGTVILKDYSSVPELSTPADYADGLAALLEDAYVSEEYLVEYAESFRESVIADKANLPKDASERQKLLEEYEKLIAQATNSQVKIVSKDPGISADKVTIIGALLNITAGKDGSLNIHEKVTDKLPGLESYTNICAFDLTLWQDDTEVELSIPVILSIPLPEGIPTVNLKILHYANGDDKAPLIIEPTLVNGKIVFEAEHFSTFVIANVASSNQNPGSSNENNNQNNNQNQNNDQNQSNSQNQNNDQNQSNNQNQNNDPKTDSSASDNPSAVNANVTSANTGDNAPIAEAVLLLFAAFVILAVYVKKRKA